MKTPEIRHTNGRHELRYSIGPGDEITIIRNWPFPVSSAIISYQFGQDLHDREHEPVNSEERFELYRQPGGILDQRLLQGATIDVAMLILIPNTAPGLKLDSLDDLWANVVLINISHLNSYLKPGSSYASLDIGLSVPPSETISRFQAAFRTIGRSLSTS